MKIGNVVNFRPKSHVTRLERWVLVGAVVFGVFVGLFSTFINFDTLENLIKPTSMVTTNRSTSDLSGMTRVIDGDTLEVAGIRIRFHGIDAPELSQRCERENRFYNCGQDAKEYLKDLIGFMSSVKCDVYSTDKYNRRIGRCFNNDGTDIQSEMALAGMAIAYTYYSNDYLKEQEIARADNRGIWAGSFQEPYQYRQQQRF